MAPAVPKALAFCTLMAPALMVVPPVKVLAAVKVAVPEPSLVSVPVPVAMMPVILMAPEPPRVKFWSVAEMAVAAESVSVLASLWMRAALASVMRPERVLFPEIFLMAPVLLMPVPFTVTGRANVIPPCICKAAPLFTVMAPAEPKAEAFCTLMAPALMTLSPEKVLAEVKVNTPAPVLVKVPEPAIPPLMVAAPGLLKLSAKVLMLMAVAAVRFKVPAATEMLDALARVMAPDRVLVPVSFTKAPLLPTPVPLSVMLRSVVKPPETMSVAPLLTVTALVAPKELLFTTRKVPCCTWVAPV